ncbi:histidine kinase, partial [Halarcobacter bivalviorum]
ELQEKIITLKEDYSNSQKEILKSHIKNSLKFIEFYYEENKNLKSKDEIKKEIIYILNKINLNENSNEYIFIYDFSGVLIDNSTDKSNIGKNFLNFTDSNKKEVVKELIETSKNSDGGFVNYFWTKPEITKERNKISYVISYEPFSWTIG